MVGLSFGVGVGSGYGVWVLWDYACGGDGPSYFGVSADSMFIQLRLALVYFYEHRKIPHVLISILA